MPFEILTHPNVSLDVSNIHSSKYLLINLLPSGYFFTRRKLDV